MRFKVIVSLVLMGANFFSFPEPLAIFSASFCGLLAILGLYFLEIDRREKL